jgi:signal transduction histidine kinase/ActR/RegA family two-component response regulator
MDRKMMSQRSARRNEEWVDYPDGRRVLLDTLKTPFYDQNADLLGLIGISRDITERIQAEEERKTLEVQLQQAQKMEAVGQLAGGIAHDFNNILTAIMGYGTMLQKKMRQDDPLGYNVEQILLAAKRAANLTTGLLAYSRKQIIDPRRESLNDIVNKVERLLARLIGEDVELKTILADKDITVLADASQMEQVLMNLAINARDAMPQGGVLSLGIALADVDAGHVVQNPEARPGQFVCLSASDTGCGIAPENLRRIFEPFFTTKAVGKGTGLGLATVYGIVNQHQGWIEVESEVNQGTTFRVFLPACQETAAEVIEPSVASRVRGGKETILVVEDEAPVRELVCGLLAGFGYEILQAESGVKALQLWNACKDKVDLVLTDLVMPDRLNGRELAEKLWADRPELKVIFTSGYSAEVVGKEFVIGEEMTYLQKPYHPNTLAAVVRDCLDASN